MKKLLTGAFAIVLLAGCSNGAPTSKTCSYTQSGVETSVTVTAPSEDSNVETLVTHVSAPYEAMNISKEDVEDNADYLSKILASTFASSMGVDDEEDLTTTYELGDDAFELEIEFDEDSLEDLIGSEEATAKAFVEALESEGFTCK